MKSPSSAQASVTSRTFDDWRFQYLDICRATVNASGRVITHNDETVEIKKIEKNNFYVFVRV